MDVPGLEGPARVDRDANGIAHIRAGSRHDLFLLQGDMPSGFSYDCGSAGWFSNETCAVPAPAAGVWYVLVQSHSNVSDLTLTATVPAPSDFSLRTQPGTAFVAAGHTAEMTVFADITSGLSQPLTLSASGVPTGATATFAPASFASGGASHLTVFAMNEFGELSPGNTVNVSAANANGIAIMNPSNDRDED